MNSKIYVLSAYAIFGLIICVMLLRLPYSKALVPPKIETTPSAVNSRIALFLLSFLILFFALRIHLEAKMFAACVGVVLGSCVFLGRWRQDYHLGMLLGLIIGSSLLWWKRETGHMLTVNAFELICFMTLSLVVVYLLDRPGKSPAIAHDVKPSPDSQPPVSSQVFGDRPKSLDGIISGLMTSKSAVTFIPISIILIGLTFSTGALTQSSLHHWGAYISPADLLLSGARPFLDFPIQYGLGPTLVISAFCGKNCFSGMYEVSALASLLHITLIYRLAISGETKSAVRHVITALVFVACFFWTTLPNDISLPTPFPSTGGLRFAPVLILASLLLVFDQPLRARSTVHQWTLHSAWIAALLWSPESAFYATFVWCPYFLYLEATAATNDSSRSKNLIFGIFRLAILVFFTIFSFIAIYWLIYRAKPSLAAYLTYAINPPGVISIKWNGSVWFAVFTLLVGSLTTFNMHARQGDGFAFRKSIIFLLMGYACFSYFLGRSHDNNVANLMPFFLLVLLHCININHASDWKKGASVAMTASILAWMGNFGYSKLTHVLEFNTDQFELAAESLLRHDEDAMRASIYVKSNFNEPTTIIDTDMNMSSTFPGSAWSSINNPANYYYISSHKRVEFLKNGASQLKKTGWLMVHENFISEDWISEYDAAYERKEQKKIGAYTLIRYSPRVAK